MPLPWFKSSGGGRKTQSNRRPNFLSSYLLNGEESTKKDHGNESEGPKMGGGRYGSAWNGRKTTKSKDIRWRPSFCSPTRSGRVRRWFAVKFHGQGRLVVALLPGWRVHQEGGRKHLPRLKPDWPEKGSKRPSSGPRVLGNFF